MHRVNSTSKPGFKPEMAAQKYNAKAIAFLDNLKNNLQLTSKELCEIMAVKPEEYSNILAGKKHISLSQFSNVAKEFHFSLEAFDQENIDLTSIIEHRKGNKSYLSQRYTEGAFSRKVMIINVLNYLDQHFPAALKFDLMKRFQFNESIRKDPDGYINFIFFEEVIQHLKKRGITGQDVFNIGTNTVNTNQGTLFSLFMGSFSSIKEMYEFYMTELIKTVEKNNLYSITKLTESMCEIQSDDNPELLDIFKIQHVGGPERCHYRLATLGAATQYMGLPHATVVESQCVHRGDPVCTFQINFEHPNYVLKNSFPKENHHEN